MRHEWVIDVLADLRKFAQSNDFPLLAEQLDDTAHIAAAEFISKNERSAQRGHAEATNDNRRFPVFLGTGGVT